MSVTLTPSQEKALQIDKNIFVEAGAGSGKTFVFVQRYLQLLRHHADLEPKHILAITFTTLAAHELVDRIREELSALPSGDPFKKRVLNGLAQARISTIHGFCSRLLKRFPIEAGLDPRFSILEPSETPFLKEQCIDKTIQKLSLSSDSRLKKLSESFKPTALRQLLVTALDNAALFYDTIDKQDPILCALKDVLDVCLETYTNAKAQRGVLDYDDLISKTETLLLDSHCLNELQREIRYIFVDEFQDTDPRQWHIIQLLCGNLAPLATKKLFVVGDVKQSIYGFRGADAQNFLRTQEAFASDTESEVVALADNFRTQDGLLHHLNPLFKTLFESETDRPIPYTPLTGFNKGDHSLSVATLSDAKSFEDEAHFMAKWIKYRQSEPDTPEFSDFAILFRRRKGFATLKRVFDSYNIPIQFDRSTGFFQLELVQDLYQLVVGLCAPSDPLCWVRVLTSPLFGVSYDALFLLRHHFPTMSLWESVHHVSGLELSALKPLGFSDDDMASLNQASSCLKQWNTRAQELSLLDTLTFVLQDAGAWDVYQGGPEGHVATPALKSFLWVIEDLERSVKSQRGLLLERLQFQMSQYESPDHFMDPESQSGVHVLTIHSSKGLEFPIVIMGECDSKFYVPKSDALLVTSHGTTLSHPQADDAPRKEVLTKLTKDTLEESKRLFYVGCTRAKQDLVFVGRGQESDCDNLEDAKTFFDFLTKLTPHNRIQRYSSLFDIPSAQHSVAGPLFDTVSDSETSRKTEVAPPTLPEPPETLLHLSASQVEKLLVCVKQFRLAKLTTLLPMPTPEGIVSFGPTIGSLVHNLIFKLNQDHTLSVSDVLSHAQNRLTQEEFDFVHTQLNHYIQHPLYTHSPLEVFHEHPFSLHVGKLIIEGRYDSLYRDENGWVVVDYKTDAVTESDLEHIQEHYITQLKLYALAVKARFNVSEPIRATLYFTRLVRSLTFTFTPEDLDRLEKRLQLVPVPLSTLKATPPSLSTCKMCSYYYANPNCPNTLIEET
jgi:ATP-dependent helicase/nuclease subunit A